MIPYNQCSKLLFEAKSGLKCVLLKSSAVPNVTHTSLAEVTTGGTEVTGTAWPSGGVAFSNLVTNTIDTDDGILDADNIAFIPTTDIGPFRYAVVTLASDNRPLAYHDFGEDKYFPAGFTVGIGIVGDYLFKILK